MADPKKRSPVPKRNTKQSTGKRSPRRKAPASQYTDVGQRQPTPRAKASPAPAPASPQLPVEPSEYQQAVVAAARAVVGRHAAPSPAAAHEPAAAQVDPNDRISSAAVQSSRRKAAVVGLALVIMATLGFAGWRHYHHTNSVADLVHDVGKVTVLPPSETPVVSTVVDKQAITQSFLASAQNGDKVLLYYQAKKAIVYRPSTRQIISIGPIAQGLARVFVRGGGATEAALQHVQTTVDSDAADFSVLSRDDSANRYPSTEVVDLTGVRPDVAQKLANLLHAKVVKLPAGESRSDGDMLVIVGQDAR